MTIAEDLDKLVDLAKERSVEIGRDAEHMPLLLLVKMGEIQIAEIPPGLRRGRRYRSGCGRSSPMGTWRWSRGVY